MKKIETTLNINPDLSLLNIDSTDRFVFFDIETTGFVALQTSLYLIGCIYKQDGLWKFCQWFLESHNEEPEALQDFSEFLEAFDTVIHFNGATFDIPYMNKKYARYRKPSPFDSLESIDIYKLISPCKKFLPIDSLKQKSCEEFLSLYREDPFSGGELIEIYKAYTETFDKKLLEVLLLHNHEDLTGMLSILPMLAYTRLTDTTPEFISSSLHCYVTTNSEEASELFLRFKLPFSIPVDFKHNLGNDIVFSASSDCIMFRIPVYSGELKYFYPNYKEYFYLPMEDCAIHKSVAQFVDKEFRQKATACNCYSKKSGTFIPINAKYTKDFSAFPVFKEAYDAATAYLELPEDTDNPDFFTSYYNLLIKSF